MEPVIDKSNMSLDDIIKMNRQVPADTAGSTASWTTQSSRNWDGQRGRRNKNGGYPNAARSSSPASVSSWITQDSKMTYNVHGGRGQNFSTGNSRGIGWKFQKNKRIYTQAFKRWRQGAYRRGQGNYCVSRVPVKDRLGWQQVGQMRSCPNLRVSLPTRVSGKLPVKARLGWNFNKRRAFQPRLPFRRTFKSPYGFFTPSLQRLQYRRLGMQMYNDLHHVQRRQLMQQKINRINNPARFQHVNNTAGKDLTVMFSNNLAKHGMRNSNFLHHGAEALQVPMVSTSQGYMSQPTAFQASGGELLIRCGDNLSFSTAPSCVSFLTDKAVRKNGLNVRLQREIAEIQGKPFSLHDVYDAGYQPMVKALSLNDYQHFKYKPRAVATTVPLNQRFSS